MPAPQHYQKLQPKGPDNQLVVVRPFRLQFLGYWDAGISRDVCSEVTLAQGWQYWLWACVQYSV